jgi:hypothetical protein
MDKERKIGYHQGSIEVLSKEREEIARMVAIVEQIMEMHRDRLRELGVDIPSENAWATPKGTKKPIDDLI